MKQEYIRNFCIIAHIDHGKSTLADRLLELTKTVTPQKMKEQLLDQMDLEREKGITIKLQPVRMEHEIDGKKYILNLIDTPGHVDFSYEVSRSLAAVEGAILLVDATQGIQAQTLANLYLALEQELVILPVINKIDMPNAKPEETAQEIKNLLGEENIHFISAKTGEGVEKLLSHIVNKLPAPKIKKEKPLQALIFDSYYDAYKGIVVYVRIQEGKLKKGEEIKILGSNTKTQALEIGYFQPQLTPKGEIKTGEIGYIATGLKDIKLCRVGDTIGTDKTKSLEGYKPQIPMVFAGIYPSVSDEYEELRDALNKLQLNDSSLSFEAESSRALGRGFKIGCLGLLHLEIVKERIKREFKIDAILTTPSVRYRIKEKHKKNWIEISSASQMPDRSIIETIEEPWVETEIICPKTYLGGVTELLKKRRGVYKSTEFLQRDRVIIKYELPLSEIIMNFYDKLKSTSSGYASFNYSPIGYVAGDLEKLDILVAGEKVEALSRIIPKENIFHEGKKTVESLKELLPKQNFAVSLQAAIGGKIIARKDISAARKDVLAKLYGGDRTRKDKLLKKQKKGKKKLKETGRVNIPSEVYLKLLRK